MYFLCNSGAGAKNLATLTLNVTTDEVGTPTLGEFTIKVTTAEVEVDEITYTSQTQSFVADGVGSYKFKVLKGADVTVECIGATGFSKPQIQHYHVDRNITGNIEFDVVHIYGVEWDKTSRTTFVRTDASANFPEPSPAIGTGTGSSPFDNIYPWSGMERVTIDGNEMVKIPKFWVKVTNTSNSFKVQIADAAVDGFEVSPMHSNRSDSRGERDFAYVSRYTVNSSYKSVSGANSVVNMTRATARSAIAALGTNYWQYDYLTLLTIYYLYLVEFANWDSQSIIGRGYVDGNSSQTTTGRTDSMTYHTGTSGSSRSANAPVQYRWIENLWENVRQWVDGITFNSADVWIQKNPSAFADAASGIKLTAARYTTDGEYITNYASDNNHSEYIVPSAGGGSESTYIPDKEWYSTGICVLVVGGNWSGGSAAGLFYFNGGYSASISGSSIGARIIYLP